MRSSLIITALMASLACSMAGCDDKAPDAGKAAKTTQPTGDKPAKKKVDKSKIKVTEEYLLDAQKKITSDNLDETVSQLEDEILTESKK